MLSAERWYSVARFVLGTYAAVHFASLVPWAAELFSSQGLVADASASPLLVAFPNVLALHDGPIFTTVLAALASVLSILVAVGYRDRAAAIGVWYILACFLGRNPLILNPSLPHIGWLLLGHALVSPRTLFAAGWVVMSASYAYSGLTKLISPSWLDGSALRHVLNNPLARPHALRDLVLELPDACFAALTWGTLALEIGFPLLACHARSRPWAWLAMVAMHLGLLVFVDFADLSVGMLVVHLFTFDPRWVRRNSTSPRPQPPTSCTIRSSSGPSTQVV